MLQLGAGTAAVARLIGQASSPHTRAAYGGALQRLGAWLRTLHRAGRAPATAALVVSAVRRAARGARELAPDGALTQQALEEIRRRAPASAGRGQARGLTAEECDTVLATCCRPRRVGSQVESEETARRRGLVDGAIVALVFHGALRCSVGWHVCKVGSRFAALEPVAQGLRRRCGSVEADAGRGLALWMDHGSQYLSDHFLNQVRYWGIRPSFGLLEEPETNGVVERWNRTLKEQAVYGRVFQNLADVRAAVAEFVERYNRCWRLEKLAYRTPLEAREEYELRQAA